MSKFLGRTRVAAKLIAPTGMRVLLPCLLLVSECVCLSVTTRPLARPRAVKARHASVVAEEGKLFGLFKNKEQKADAEAEALADAEDKKAEGMTLEKVASFGIAGVLSIAVAETVFWVLSFPTSELLYFVSTGATPALSPHCNGVRCSNWRGRKEERGQG